jgi:putative FmdB family regulatory protein
MPLYDYKCKCGKIIEVLKRMGHAPKTIGCSCGERAERIYSMPHINFNNWVPDYRQMDGEKEAIAAGMYE